jgi:D-psicose/D-tagatose/L-ribulose 3-epimerase
MRLAISNIAWDTSEDTKIAQLLQRYDIDAIDIAPGKYFPNPSQATTQEISYVKQWWLDHGVEITGMQALLFGTSGLNIFATAEIQAAMLNHLAAICRIASGLGAKHLVFGSPKNRDRTNLTDQHAKEIAIDFFMRLGNIAQSFNTIICLEPNPSCYGCNFMVTSFETAEIVTLVNHPAIKMQLDTGALTINKEDVLQVIKRWDSLIAHIHLSEPELLPLGDGDTPHHEIQLHLTQYLSTHVAAIEMLATKHEQHEISIERALKNAVRYYRAFI